MVHYITASHACHRKSAGSLAKSLGFNVSPNTIKAPLYNAGYNHHIARRRPFLKNKDRKICLKFAKKYAHWTIDDWKRVIWTDEMSVKTGMARAGQDWIWRKPDEEFHPDCINYRKRHNDVGVFPSWMHWTGNVF